MALDKNLFRNWIDGDVFSARDYVYERNTIIDYVNNLPTVDNVLAEVADDYYSKIQLDGGQLDNRYYTETELLTNGVLDARYYREGEVDGLLNTERNRLNRLESKFDATVLAENDQLFDQAVNTDSAVEFASVKIGANTLNEAFVDGLENKYTTAQVDTLLTGKVSTSVLGQANGVATLDGDGRLPVGQLPLNTVVFRGTFGDGVGDLPTENVETGDFYICVSNGYVSAVAGQTFDTGDKAVYDGTNWSKIDNTETVTGVKGDEEVDYRIGNVSIGYEDVGAAAASHAHGNITNAGAIGATSNQVVITGTDGVLTTASRDSIDSRTAFPPASHTHGNITNDGKIGSTSDQVVVTGADGVLATASRSGIDSRTEYPPSAHTHDDRYYTETELNDGQLDNRYYTETEVNDALALKLNTNLKGAVNGLAELDANGLVPTSQLPSYVDGLDEFADFASFPATGILNRIYVALDTGKTYRWGGSAYAEISPSEVNSVNSKTGVVVLSDADIAVDASGFSGVLDTDDTDVEKALTTLDAHTHAYSEITNKPLLYTQGEVDAFLAEKANVSDLSATITLYPTTTPSAVTGYFTMVTDITDDRYNDTAFDVGTGAISTTNQLIASLATDANIFTGNPGVINVNTIGNIRKTAGNSSQYAEFFFRIYKRDAAGTETLLGTSDTTGAVNPEDNTYYEFSASALLNNGSFIATDRLVIKYYANAMEGTVAEYDFQFGGTNPVRTFLPVPVRVLQSAEKIVYDNTTSGLTATDLQAAVDELDQLIAENTSVLKIQRFVITNADNGNGTFSYTWEGNARTGTLATGQYRFDLEDDVEYIVGQNRLEIKINNNINFYSPDLEIEEIDIDTVGITYALQNNDEVFIKVYQGLDSVALVVADGSITTAKLSQGLQSDLTSYDNHLASTANPHSVTKSQVGLSAVTNDAQVKKAASSTDGHVPKWSGTAGDAIVDGYSVQTTLSSSTTALVRADAVQSAVNSLNSLIDGKQATLVSGTNIKTINGSSILGSGNYVIDIPSVDVTATAPDINTANVGDLWWNTNNAVLYIAYDDGSSKQWVEVSYADIQAEVNALINGAPGALDTLNELAAAMGDDPNFATTVTNAIAAKVAQSEFDTFETNTNTAIATKSDKLASFVAVSANRTLELTDGAKILSCTNTDPITVTVPANATIAFPVGTQIAVLRNGTGTVTFAAASGVTIHSAEDLLDISVQYASAALIKKAENTWQLIGSLG